MKKLISLAIVAMISSSSFFVYTHLHPTDDLTRFEQNHPTLQPETIEQKLRRKQIEVERARQSRIYPGMSFSIDEEMDYGLL